jgi:hypothetical protein
MTFHFLFEALVEKLFYPFRERAHRKPMSGWLLSAHLMWWGAMKVTVRGYQMP